MKGTTRVILLEFNELTPSLIDRFIGEGKLPNFERFRRESRVYVTDAQERQDRLNPWIQWVTVHTGASSAEHGIRELDEGHKLSLKCVWDVLADAGLRVWICGSMNVNRAPRNAWVVPDPWATAVVPHPRELIPYFRFVQRNVQEHTNAAARFRRADYLRFLGFMAAHGLSLSTVSSIVRQLVSERTAPVHWKRVVLLDKLQWDVFRWYFRKVKPDFSTFFLNSTAHLQHKHWRNLEPGAFKVQPSASEQARFENAILFGYEEMDKLLGRFLDLAGDDTTLVFSTALSQQPCLTYEEQGGKTFYRPREFEEFFRFAGVSGPHSCAPVMSERFHVLFQHESDARDAEARLRSLLVNGEPAMFVQRDGVTINSGCKVSRQLPPDATLSSTNAGTSARFFDLFYQAEATKSGMHHPDGVLWIRMPDRKPLVHPEKVPLRAIAPTILEMFGAPRPEFMRAEPLTAEATARNEPAQLAAT